MLFMVYPYVIASWPEWGIQGASCLNFPSIRYKLSKTDFCPLRSTCFKGSHIWITENNKIKSYFYKQYLVPSELLSLYLELVSSSFISLNSFSLLDTVSSSLPSGFICSSPFYPGEQSLSCSLSLGCLWLQAPFSTSVSGLPFSYSFPPWEHPLPGLSFSYKPLLSRGAFFFTD